MLTSEGRRQSVLTSSIYYPFRGCAARCARGDGFAQGDGERFDARLDFVVGVLAVVAVEVKRESSVLGEGAQELGEELHVESAYLLRHRAEVAREVAPGPEVDDGRRERLDERRARVGEAHDVAPLAERPVEGASEHEPCVLDRVVAIHPRIALGLNLEVHAGMV